jgi:hypothetical protein
MGLDAAGSARQGVRDMASSLFAPLRTHVLLWTRLSIECDCLKRFLLCTEFLLAKMGQFLENNDECMDTQTLDEILF